jgi:hypothetical protein
MVQEAGLLLQAGASSRRGVLLVCLARGAARGQRRHIGRERVCVRRLQLRFVGRRRRARLRFGGRAHCGQQSHGILEDVREVECAGRVVALARAALGRLLGGGEGLLRGRTGATHIAASCVKSRWRGRELKAVAVRVGCHGGVAVDYVGGALKYSRKARLRAATVTAEKRRKAQSRQRRAIACRDGQLIGRCTAGAVRNAADRVVVDDLRGGLFVVARPIIGMESLYVGPSHATSTTADRSINTMDQTRTRVLGSWADICTLGGFYRIWHASKVYTMFIISTSKLGLLCHLT